MSIFPVHQSLEITPVMHVTTRTCMKRLLKRAMPSLVLFLACSYASHASANELYFNAKKFLHTKKSNKKDKQLDQTLHVIAHPGDWQNQAHYTTCAHKSKVNLTPNDYARKAEQDYGIPTGLLSALAFVESKCTPYAVHAKGRGHFFNTKAEAVHFVNTMRAQGVRNIDVGYMQLNVPSHISQFRSIDQMLDIESNIRYAARLLKQLYKRYGNWPHAVERYRSVFCDESRRYQAHVYQVWGTGQGLRHNYARRTVAIVDAPNAPVPLQRKPKPRVYAISHHTAQKTCIPDSATHLKKSHHIHTHTPSIWNTTYHSEFLRSQRTDHHSYLTKKVSFLDQLTKPIAHILNT